MRGTRAHAVAATTGILALLSVGGAVVDEQRRPGPVILAAATSTSPNHTRPYDEPRGGGGSA